MSTESERWRQQRVLRDIAERLSEGKTMWEQRWFLEIVENGHRIPTGNLRGYQSEEDAVKDARRHTDDALPRNYVRVLCLVGVASLAGDGGETFERVAP